MNDRTKNAKQLFQMLRARGFAFRMDESGIKIDGSGANLIPAELLARVNAVSDEFRIEVAENLAIENCLKSTTEIGPVLARELLSRDPGNQAAIACLSKKVSRLPGCSIGCSRAAS